MLKQATRACAAIAKHGQAKGRTIAVEGDVRHPGKMAAPLASCTRHTFTAQQAATKGSAPGGLCLTLAL